MRYFTNEYADCINYDLVNENTVWTSAHETIWNNETMEVVEKAEMVDGQDYVIF